MQRYKLTIEYDGRFFHGWQYQAGLETVQSVLRKAAYAFTQENVEFFGAGRTDKGVHALGQVAHVNFIRPLSQDKVRLGINFYLKETGIVITKAENVSFSFHARFSAISRRYSYVILNRPSPSVLYKNKVLWINRPLCLEDMKEAAKILEGTHDFSNFRSKECQALSALKTLDYIKLEKANEFIKVNVKARSFLQRQVRLMVGALLRVGLKKWKIEVIKELLEKTNSPTFPLVSAPPYGLYLEEVEYPQEV